MSLSRLRLEEDRMLLSSRELSNSICVPINSVPKMRNMNTGDEILGVLNELIAHAEQGEYW